MNKALGQLRPVQKIVLVGVMSAMVFALSWVTIPLGEVSRIHLGNIMCLLSGVLFGPVVGGLSAGFGSMLFDFTNPLYISEFWITFLMKFAMGFIAGGLANAARYRLPAGLRDALPAVVGAVSYVGLYVGKSIIFQHWVYGNPWAAVWPVVLTKGIASAINAGIAVAGCTLLAPVLRAALHSAGLFRKKHA